MKLKSWQYLPLIFSLVLMLGCGFIGPLGGLNRTGTCTLGIFAGTMLLLILIDTTWPVLLCICAFAVSGVYSFSEAVRGSLGHHLFWFIIICTTMMSAVTKSGILKRIAVWLISRPITKKNPWYLVAAIYLSVFLLGSFITCTPLMVLYKGLFDQIFAIVGYEKGNRTAEKLFMGLMFSAAMSSGFTPFGHPMSLLSIETFSKIADINILKYVLVSIPVCTAVLFGLLLVFRFCFRLDLSGFRHFDPADMLRELGPVKKEEKFCLGILIFNILWWVLPSAIENVLPGVYAVMDRLTYIFPVFLATAALSIIPVNGKPVLNFSVALRDGSAAWATGFPVAFSMLFGSALVRPEAGIIDFLSRAAGPVLGNMNGFVFVLITCLGCTLVANFASVTLGMTIFSTISVTFLMGNVVTGVNAAALCIALANVAGYSFSTPICAYSALTAQSGWVRKGEQMRLGLSSGMIFSLIIGSATYLIGSMVM